MMYPAWWYDIIFVQRTSGSWSSVLSSISSSGSLCPRAAASAALASRCSFRFLRTARRLCRAVPCCAVRCAAIRCGAVRCCAVLCGAVPCRAVLCRAVLCCAVPCRAVPCRAVLCCASFSRKIIAGFGGQNCGRKRPLSSCFSPDRPETSRAIAGTPTWQGVKKVCEARSSPGP